MNCTHCGWPIDLSHSPGHCPVCGRPVEQSEPPRGEPYSQEPRSESLTPSPSQTGLATSCPWEDQDRLGLFSAMTRTVSESLFQPEAFFSAVPHRGGFLIPLLYALIVETIAAMASSFWGTVLGHTLLSGSLLTGKLTVVGAILMPFFVLVVTVVWAGLLHLSLIIVGGAKEGFEATFRVVCYSSGPELLNLIPAVGGIIGLVWKVYLTLVGLRKIHGITTMRAASAIVIPVLFTCGLAITVLAFIVAGVTGLVP